MLDEMRESLERFGVHFDVWFSERSLHEGGAVEHALDKLRAQGHVYEATAPPGCAPPTSATTRTGC